MEVDEISLVNSPATRKRFLIVKHDDIYGGKKIMDKELLELLKEWVGNDEDLNMEEILKAAVPGKVVTALKSALKVLNTYKDELPDDLKKSMVVIAKYAVAGYGYPAPKDDKKKQEDDLEKAGKAISKDTISKMGTGIKTVLTGVKQLNEILPEDARINKAEEELSKEMKAMTTVQKTIEDLGTQIKTLESQITESVKGKDNDSEDDGGKGNDEENGKSDKGLETEKRLKALEKATAKKKGLDDDDNKSDPDKDLFPSLKS